MMTYPGESGEGGAARSSTTQNELAEVDAMTIEQLRAELTLLRDREQQIAELLKAPSRDKILHDLRNLLNEVQLLRILAEQADA